MIFVREGDAGKRGRSLRTTLHHRLSLLRRMLYGPLPQRRAWLIHKVRQRIEAPMMKFPEAFNNRDTATIGTLQTDDIIEVRSWQGLASGRETLKTRLEADFAGNPGKMVNKLVALYPIGSAMCEIADSDVGGNKVHTMVIYVRDGGIIPGREAWPMSDFDALTGIVTPERG